MEADTKLEAGSANEPNRLKYSRRNFWSGFLFGLGMIAFIDEMVFHQLLRWHHFYDRATTDVGLISDGLFHAFSWFATIGGLFMFADLRRRRAVWLTRWWGAVLLGAGIFQLYDGLIQHKVFRIHQIRYVENLIVYDIIWNTAAVIMILAGIYLLRRAQKSVKREEGRS
ncbi:DUF2243 domain-containing protein [Salipaludibacillus sp. CUR1]|uniref:DUF2243 domain-containing protein n=1 Tax=Salipaludibacillus sp. CUR1 TaxID=2820003 RepID=UPI001E2E8B50|nr:DUF2243 domain-containing protein [Salipaludibacillus sp. CUR1]MCE7794453.1 DUF2243 domain-containing protein [Salipaludibacillus sp. CUR1]